MTDLHTYRTALEAMPSGSLIPVEYAREVVQCAIREATAGELTMQQAIEASGRSRSWIAKRVRGWAAQGLARQVGNAWIISPAALPKKSGKRAERRDLSADERARQLLAA